MQAEIDTNCYWSATRNAHLWLTSVIAIIWMIILATAMMRAETYFSHDKSLMDNAWKVVSIKLRVES